MMYRQEGEAWVGWSPRGRMVQVHEDDPALLRYIEKRDAAKSVFDTLSDDEGEYDDSEIDDEDEVHDHDDVQ